MIRICGSICYLYTETVPDVDGGIITAMGVETGDPRIGDPRIGDLSVLVLLVNVSVRSNGVPIYVGIRRE
jgi:hypothetical protein